MSRKPPISAKAMQQLGWTRTDPRPWSKLNARWSHVSGWRLEHCGHPTALYPWALYCPRGRLVLRGIAEGYPPSHGMAWANLRAAAEWLQSWLTLPEQERLNRWDVWRDTWRDELELERPTLTHAARAGLKSIMTNWLAEAVPL